mmetsp:Transcript_31199/g.83009  ORF Transcript_31199/g.83009 Transcript_31199/m.83009 type:complete len:277 (-) Transcript_31199:1062-1892(-)
MTELNPQASSRIRHNHLKDERSRMRHNGLRGASSPIRQNQLRGARNIRHQLRGASSRLCRNHLRGASSVRRNHLRGARSRARHNHSRGDESYRRGPLPQPQAPSSETETESSRTCRRAESLPLQVGIGPQDLEVRGRGVEVSDLRQQVRIDEPRFDVKNPEVGASDRLPLVTKELGRGQFREHRHRVLMHVTKIRKLFCVRPRVFARGNGLATLRSGEMTGAIVHALTRGSHFGHVVRISTRSVTLSGRVVRNGRARKRTALVTPMWPLWFVGSPK